MSQGGDMDFNFKEFYLTYRSSTGSFHEFLHAEEAATSSATEATDTDADDTRWYIAYHQAALRGYSPLTGEIEVVADRLAIL
jgi:hypothetical protein